MLDRLLFNLILDYILNAEDVFCCGLKVNVSWVNQWLIPEGVITYCLLIQKSYPKWLVGTRDLTAMDSVI